MAALRELWALRHRRPRFVAGSAAVLAFLLVFPVVHLWLQSRGVTGGLDYYDLGAYRIAVENWRAGEPIYWRNDGGGFHGSYLYPPVYLLAFWPLADPAFDTAGHLLNAVSVGLLWVGLQAVVAAYGLRLAWFERGLLLWAVVGYYPVVISARLAQVSVFLAGLLSVALAALLYADRRDARGDGRRARAWAALGGAATAVAGTVKLIYAPAGAHLLADRRRFAAAVATGVALLAVSLAVFGVETHRLYLEVLTWGKGWGESRHPQWWGPAYYRPLYVLGATAGMAVRLLLAAGISALALLAADEGVDDLVFALGVAAVPLLAPRAYTQDLAVFLPVVVVLLATELRRSDGRPLVPVVGLWLAAVHALGLYAVVDVLPDRLPGGGLLIDAAPLLQPGLWGTVLLVGLAGWRVAEATTLPPSVRRRVTGR